MVMFELLDLDFVENDWVLVSENIDAVSDRSVHDYWTDLAKKRHATILLCVAGWDCMNHYTPAHVVDAGLVAGSSHFRDLFETLGLTIRIASSHQVPSAVKRHRQSLILAAEISGTCD